MLFILFVWFVTFLIFRCEKFFFCKNFLIACQSNKITLIANRNNIGKLFCNTDNENHHAIEISSIFVNTKKVITVFYGLVSFCFVLVLILKWVEEVLVQFWWRSSFCVLKLPHLFFFFFFPTTTMIYYLFMYDLYSGNQMVVVTNQQKVTSLILFNSFVL